MKERQKRWARLNIYNYNFYVTIVVIVSDPPYRDPDGPLSSRKIY